MKKICIVLLFISAGIRALSQDCNWFPADCPDDASIQASQDISQRLQNGLLLQEINMQDSMRALITSLMLDASKALHWKMIEMDEITNLNPFQKSETPCAQRSPRYFGIEFQFIVNTDSLQAWKNWLVNFSNRYAEAAQNSITTQTKAAESSLYKQYSDSVERYTKLYTAYITAHPNIAADTDKHLKNLSDKENEYNEKRTQLINSSTNDSFDLFEEEKIQRNKTFREASTVEIFFEINAHTGIVYSDDGKGTTTSYNLPVATISRFVHLSDPDENTLPWHFQRWPNSLLVLLGNWIKGPNQQSNYNASFTLKGQDDEHTIKQIKSNKVQTIAVHIMGSKENIDQLVKQVDWGKLNAGLYLR